MDSSSDSDNENDTDIKVQYLDHLYPRGKEITLFKAGITNDQQSHTTDSSAGLYTVQFITVVQKCIHMHVGTVFT